MKKFIYRIANFIALLTFITNLLNGTTLLTSIIRSVIAFLIMLFLSVIMLKILRWTLMLSQKESSEEIIKSPEK